MVGAEGFEPPTLCSQSRCATRLRYAPTLLDCNLYCGCYGLSVLEDASKTPCHEEDGDAEYNSEHTYEQQQEAPITPCVAARLVQVELEEAIVAAVRLPGNVKDIAEKGNGTDEYPDGEIDGHTEESDIRDATNPGGYRNHEREKSGDDVAETRDQANDAIDPESEVGAGDAESLVEQYFKLVQRFVAAEQGAAVPAAGLWKQNLRGVSLFRSNGHRVSRDNEN